MGLSEGEGHGLELSGNFTSLWPPLSQMDSVCASSGPVALSKGVIPALPLLAFHDIYCCCLGPKDSLCY